MKYSLNDGRALTADESVCAVSAARRAVSVCAVVQNARALWPEKTFPRGDDKAYFDLIKFPRTALLLGSVSVQFSVQLSFIHETIRLRIVNVTAATNEFPTRD